jgi:flagellar motility protein MotE (MotC chaperone)
MKAENQEYSKLQWFIMVILIPVIFAIILFSIILSFMGLSVIDEGKQLASKTPFLSKYVKTEEQLVEEVEKVNIDELTAKISTHLTEIGVLEQKLTAKDNEIQVFQDEIELLLAQLEDQEAAEVDITTEYKEIAKLYETMSAKNAASILIELPEDEAVVHLSFMKTDARAAIFAKMAPDKAAQLILQLSTN